MSSCPPGRVQVRAIRPAELEAARALLVAGGWQRRGVRTPSEFQELLARSQLALVAVDADEVIGFLRALTDGMSNGYISMMVVAQHRQGQGVGSALVRAAIGQDKQVTWVLRAGREGVAGFCEKLGFSRSHVAMEHRRVE